MRVSFNSIVVAALLSSVPFASIARSYPTGSGHETLSKRGISPKPPSDPFRDPSPGSPGKPGSPAPSDPFRDPSHSPSIPGSPGSAAGAWRGFVDGDLKLTDDLQNKQRDKGEKLVQDLETAILHKSNDKIDQSMHDAGYSGQGVLNETPKLGIDKNPYTSFGIDISKKWRGDDIKKPGSATIVKTYEDPQSKATVIVAESWNKAQDAKGALSWTAMVMSNWRAAANAASIKVGELKYVVRNNILSIDTTTTDGVKLNTVNAIDGAFDALKVDKKNTLMLDAKTADKAHMQQFLILAAQTHVSRVISMLKDYRGELGDLQVTKLHLQTNQNPVSQYQHNLVIELGH